MGRTRLIVTLLGITFITGGYLFLSAAGPGGPRLDLGLLFFIGFTAWPFLLYINLVRTRAGTNVGGALLLAASVPPFLALEYVFGIDSGLEVLNVPVVTFVAGLVAVGIDSFSRSSKRTP